MREGRHGGLPLRVCLSHTQSPAESSGAVAGTGGRAATRALSGIMDAGKREAAGEWAGRPRFHARKEYSPAHMAEKARKIPINQDEPDTHDNSFEAANAIPAVQDDQEDERNDRQPIDLDAPVASPPPAPAPATPAADPAPEFDDAPAAGPAPSSAEMDALKLQAAQANEDYLRARADLQNFRRRGEDERLRIIRDANERLIKELLPVLDDFDLALDAARKTESYEQLIGGVSAIVRKFQDTLTKQGVDSIPATGEKFDAEVHEAVMLDEESDEPDETVTAELRKGYTLHGRVIRPSLVKVAKKG